MITTDTATQSTYNLQPVTILETHASQYGQEALIQYDNGQTEWVSVHAINWK